jgi:metallo-beta-lactamase family protein
VRIDFLGAARNVTGSMHLLTVNGAHILLECGLFQGRRQESFDRNRNLPFDATIIQTMVLSHAHIDHSGNIPNLVRSGFRGPIHATSATKDLCEIMLLDSAHIMESDVEYVNKKRLRQGLGPLEPIYTINDARASLERFFGADYDQPVEVAPGVQLTFRDAGHILGSALCVLDIAENGHRFRLLFTGDLGRPHLPILRDPQVVPDVDYLMTESTYGTRLHGKIGEAENQLKVVVNETYSRGGKLIIPAFSVGRTQEIVYSLHHLRDAGQIPHLPIYVDSPLSTNATDVFLRHPECYDAETLAFMRRDPNPFGFGELRYLRQTEDSKALNARTDPMVIISASGMCESGRILHHLKNNIEDARNTILFVGFQAENTLGRRILDGQDPVSIFGEPYRVRARIERIDGYSAHADRDELLSYVQALGPKRLRRAFIVHGEEEAELAFEKALHDIGVADTLVPRLGDNIAF